MTLLGAHKARRIIFDLAQKLYMTQSTKVLKVLRACNEPTVATCMMATSYAPFIGKLQLVIDTLSFFSTAVDDSATVEFDLESSSSNSGDTISL